jgi:hypothetical protein
MEFSFLQFTVVEGSVCLARRRFVNNYTARRILTPKEGAVNLAEMSL